MPFWKFITAITLSLVTFLFWGCGKETKLKNFPPPSKKICCFGDSLVYGTGAASLEDSYPRELEKITELEVLSFGTPGDTTAQALPKCKSLQNQGFGIIIVTLGGNDILQRVRWEKTEKNLHSLFQTIQTTGAVVVFTGITGPLNPTRNKLYKKICKKEGVLYIPEILDGIIDDPSLRADEVHPNSQGYRIMAERIAKSLKVAKLF